MKKLLKFFLPLLLLLILPSSSLAITCSDAGGTCASSGSCTTIQSGTYDPCSSGQDCCSSSTSASTATTYQEGSTGGFLFLKNHLVPCGRSTDDSGSANFNETDPCTLCHLIIMIKNIFDLVLSLVIIATILFLTIGGVVYIVSTGNSKLTGIAKEIITKTLIGFALMLVGWLLVYTLLTFLSAGNMIGKGTANWFDFDCNTTSNFSTTN